MAKIYFADDAPRRVNNGIERYLFTLIQHLRHQGQHTLLIRTPSVDPSSKWRRWLSKAVRFFVTDVLRSHSQSIDLYFSATQRVPFLMSRKMRTLVTIHDLCYRQVPQTMRWYTRWMDRLFLPHALKKAHRIIAVSASTAQDIAQYFPEHQHKVTVIPLAGGFQMEKTGREAPQLELPRPMTPRYFLFVGTCEPRKNLMRLLQAYAQLAPEMRQQTKLVIIGNPGWGGIDLSERVAALNLTADVRLEGKVSEAALIQWYQHAHALVMPSLYEGFGLPILEAQHFGVPVLTANVASMPEVVGAGGLCVDPTSVAAIQQGLQTLIENSEQYHIWSQAAVQNAARYSWEHTAQQTLAVIEAVLLSPAEAPDYKNPHCH